MGSAAARAWNFGIIYAATGESPLPTYVDVKDVTQSYIALVADTYTEMTTITSGGVDTSKPFADGCLGITLSCEIGIDQLDSITIKLQGRRFDETTWFDLQTVSENDPSTTAAEHTFPVVAMQPVTRVALQTASIFTAGQIRVVAYYTGEGPTSGDYLLVRAMVA